MDFLHLPQLVRYKIYRYAGVPFNEQLQLDWVNDQADLTLKMMELWGSVDLTPYLRIRSVSRSLYRDITTFVCASNEVLVCCKPDTRLDIVVQTPMHLLECLSNLTIHLNMSRRNDWYPYFRCKTSLCAHYDAAPGFDPPFLSHFKACMQPSLKLAATREDPLLERWRRAVGRLEELPNRASRLRLELIADVADVTTSDLISQPLRSLQFASCTVRFAQNKNEALQSAAYKTSALSTRASGQRSLQPFRFFDLPVEQQLHILSYTDLITPHRQVHWLESRGYWIPHHGKKGGCSKHWLCSLEFAVYPPCGCWQSPTALFLTSKAMRRLSQNTFFSSNRFIFVDTGTTMWLHDDLSVNDFYQPADLTACSFLMGSLRSSTTNWLRDIELVFNNDASVARHMYENLKLWNDTIEAISSETSNLTIRLYLNFRTERLPLTEDGFEDMDHASSWTLENCDKDMLESHHEFVQALAKIKGLRRLFIHPTPPWCYPEVYGAERFKSHLYSHADLLEAEVMGSAYDSAKAGKWSDATSECLCQPPPGWMG